MRRVAWDHVKNRDVLGHALVKHKPGQNVSELVDTLWSYFDPDKNETTYCFGQMQEPWKGPTLENLVRFQLTTDHLRNIFYADHQVETENQILDVDEGFPWLLAWNGLPMSHYYVRDSYYSKTWRKHTNQVIFKNGLEAGHTPSDHGELPKPFRLIKKKPAKKRKDVKKNPTITSLSTG